ncbi:unnamed protein product [Prunus armeniaca]
MTNHSYTQPLFLPPSDFSCHELFPILSSPPDFSTPLAATSPLSDSRKYQRFSTISSPRDQPRFNDSPSTTELASFTTSSSAASMLGIERNNLIIQGSHLQLFNSLRSVGAGPKICKTIKGVMVPMEQINDRKMMDEFEVKQQLVEIRTSKRSDHDPPIPQAWSLVFMWRNNECKNLGLQRARNFRA